MKFFSRKKRPAIRTKSQINTNKSPYLSNSNFIKKRRISEIKNSKANLNQSLNTPLRKRKPTKGGRKFRILALFFIIILSVTSVYSLFYSDFFKVKEVQFFEDDIQINENEKIKDIFREQVFLKNIITTDLNPLKQAITDNFPEYETIRFEKKYPQTLIVKADKYATIANFLNIISNPDGTKIQKKFQINSHGILTNENEEIPELPYLVMQTKEALKLKSNPIDQENLKNILQSINLFEEKFGMQVIEAEYFAIEREVHLKTEKLFWVWLDLTRPLLGQVDKLKKALPKLDIYKTPLQYIDLRISGPNAEKVIYKSL